MPRQIICPVALHPVEVLALFPEQQAATVRALHASADHDKGDEWEWSLCPNCRVVEAEGTAVSP